MMIPTLLWILPALLASQEPETTKLEDLAWLTGNWHQQTEMGLVEELWMPPRADLMLGLNRTTRKGGARAQFEYLRIEMRKDGIYYVASPGGKGSTAFRLVENGETRAVFTNPEHDFPKRIVYERKGDRLTARVEGEPGKGFALEWKLAGKIE